MVAVIGDIHGCYLTFVELFNKIKLKYKNIDIYCVGDIVDRGNNSFEVFRFIVEENIKFVIGNHDYMFYNYYRNPGSSLARSWVFNGNEATIESYQRNNAKFDDHLDIIENARFYYNLKDCFISHAGISQEFEEELMQHKFSEEIFDSIVNDNIEEESGVLWVRGKLANLNKLQIVGHTKFKDVIYNESSNSAYIDTGACVGNKLSAVIVHESEIVETIEQKTHLDDII